MIGTSPFLFLNISSLVDFHAAFHLFCKGRFLADLLYSECCHEFNLLNKELNIHEEYATIGDTSYCDQYINEIRDDNHSTYAFYIVSNASTDLGCHEDEIVPFGNPKDNEQIFISACDRFEYVADSKVSPQFFYLQTKEESNKYEEEDDDPKSPDQQFIMHSSQS